MLVLRPRHWLRVDFTYRVGHVADVDHVPKLQLSVLKEDSLKKGGKEDDAKITG